MNRKIEENYLSKVNVISFDFFGKTVKIDIHLFLQDISFCVQIEIYIDICIRKLSYLCQIHDIFSYTSQNIDIQNYTCQS